MSTRSGVTADTNFLLSVEVYDKEYVHLEFEDVQPQITICGNNVEVRIPRKIIEKIANNEIRRRLKELQSW